MATSADVIEGVKTLETVRSLVAHLGVTTPIVEILYRVFFKNMSLKSTIFPLFLFFSEAISCSNISKSFKIQ